MMETPPSVLGPDGPPPLVPDSVAARLLFRIWSGDWMVRGWPQTLRDDVPSVAATVVSHLHLRAGFNILIVGSPKVTDACRAHLVDAVPATSINSVIPPDSTDPMVWLADPAEDAKYFLSGKRYDLVVVTDLAPEFSYFLGACLVAGRQILSFGREQPIRFEDREDLDMPLDVSFAGGVEQ